MTDLLFIHWNPDPVAFSILGREIRWYGLCWCAGLLLGYLVMQRLYRQQGIPKEKFEPLFLYVFVGVLAGFGMFVSLWLYIRKYKVNAMRVLDNMGICAPLTACFIRLGNLFNSEIVGKTTDMPWGFVFAANGDTVARHPGQLYESLAYIAVFFIGLLLYRAYRQKVGTGFFFGWCLTSIFTFRFFIEFIKEVQEEFENAILLDMGQILSIPLIIIGAYCLAGGRLCRRLGEQKSK